MTCEELSSLSLGIYFGLVFAAIIVSLPLYAIAKALKEKKMNAKEGARRL